MVCPGGREGEQLPVGKSDSSAVREWEELCLASNFLLVQCCGAENELRAQMPRQKRKKIELLKQKVSYGAAEVGAGERDRSVRQVDVSKMSKALIGRQGADADADADAGMPAGTEWDAVEGYECVGGR
ncbi:uncharacterized protein UDID_17872 [Ustilago sp. UG-2017a]|nr:uncharacterized protein UDID_17872 [Ustilago sp. UG-2017a]